MRIEVSIAKGTISVPSSKSYAHRLLICAALSNSDTLVYNVTLSKDIIATINCLRTLGYIVQIDNDIVNIKASVEDYEYTPIDGATEAVYAATDDSLYVCKVTFADGTTEMSDVYEGPHPHDYKAVVTDPTCTEDGYTTYTCSTCGNTSVDDETDATGHDDTDNDGYCDICDELICNHNCHKGGIVGFFWKITRFFNKLFKTNQYCECGVAHY